jgi:NAD(P)-dependent dehydrogenase (short-subunit alcohol dehydrogenase family)
MAVACDVTDVDSIHDAVARAVERWSRIDVLVNTAGGDAVEPEFTEQTDDLWDRVIDLNLQGVMRVIRACLPHLLASGAGASIVTVGSVNGMTALGSYPYSVAKGGLEILTRNLAAEYGPRGVRVNLIVPATIRTRVWDDQQESLARLARLYPLGRVGEPEDIAAAVAFLASDDASWITGITLPVDGGFLTGPKAWLS